MPIIARRLTDAGDQREKEKNEREVSQSLSEKQKLPEIQSCPSAGTCFIQDLGKKVIPWWSGGIKPSPHNTTFSVYLKKKRFP